MIRVLLFLGLVALMAFGVVWFADRPGDVAIVWQGYRIETSVMVGLVAVAALALIAVIVWSIVRTILRSPTLIAMFMSHRRGVRGYLAVSRGLIAVGAGDASAAKRARMKSNASRRASRSRFCSMPRSRSSPAIAPRPSIAFRAMAERDDTKLLGLRGLYIEAQRGRTWSRPGPMPRRPPPPRPRSAGPDRRRSNSAALRRLVRRGFRRSIATAATA
jgi:HemY protein